MTRERLVRCWCADAGVIALMARFTGLELLESNCCLVDDLWPGYSTNFYLNLEKDDE